MSPLILPVILSSLLMTGCAQFGDTKATKGAAVYKLESSDCKVEIVSARDFVGGDLKVGENCSIEASVDSVDALRAIEMARILLGVTDNE